MCSLEGTLNVEITQNVIYYISLPSKRTEPNHSLHINNANMFNTTLSPSSIENSSFGLFQGSNITNSTKSHFLAVPSMIFLLKNSTPFLSNSSNLLFNSSSSSNVSGIGVSNVSSQVTPSGGICPYEDTQVVKIAKATAYSIVMLTSLICNSLVVTVVAKNRRMRTAVNMFIVNMAVSDLLITAFFMPRMLSRIFTGIEWTIPGTAGLILCKISPSMQELCSSLSVLMFIAIAVERFVAVLMPLKTLVTKRISCYVSIGIWIIALAIRFPSFYGLQLFKIKSNIYCALQLDDPIADKIYQHFSFITFYAVPLCIAIALYSCIMCTLKRRTHPGNGNQIQHNVQLRRNYKILKMLVTVVITFTICWFLYFCLPVLKKEMDYDIMCHLFFPRFFLSHLNCAINPMIYLVCIENYRRNVRALLTGVMPGPITTQRQQIPSAVDMTRL